MSFRYSTLPQVEQDDSDEEGDSEAGNCLHARSRLAQHLDIRTPTGAGIRRCMLVVICANTMLLAVEADYPDLTCLQWLETLFILVYVAELSLRLTAYGCDYFTDDKGWGIFDFVIVVCGVIDEIVSWTVKFRFGRILLACRVVRIMRVLLLLKYVDSMRAVTRLVQSLIKSMQSALWVALLLLILIFASAIFVTKCVGRHPDDFEDPEAIEEWFGSIPRSMSTLFIFLTFDGWSTAARMVNEKQPGMEAFWIGYLLLGAWTFLSLLAAIMADCMDKERQHMEVEAQREFKAREVHDLVEDFRRVFKAADASGHQRINQEEFHRMLRKKDLAEKLRGCGVDVDSAKARRRRRAARGQEDEEHELFEAFGVGEDGLLGWEHMKAGLPLLCTPKMRPHDLMQLEGLLCQIQKELSRDFEPPAWQRQLARLHARASLLQEQMGNLEREVAHLFSAAGFDEAAWKPLADGRGGNSSGLEHTTEK